MAEDLVRRDAEMPPPEADAIVPVEAQRRESGVYRFRFGLAYVALAILAGAGIGSAILLVNRPAGETGAQWSNWQPTGRESDFTDQIATYVSGRYRLPSGNPLVGILSSPPQVPTQQGEVPIQQVAIQNDPGGDRDDIDFVATEGSVMYNLCGLGPQCSIREGQPSQERHRLLRREALEVALYTFKYTDSKSVIALMPSNPQAETSTAEAQTSTALFFRRSDLEGELDQPLTQTLSQADPSEAIAIERPRIDRLTSPRLFAYDVIQTQAGGFFLVLAPIE